MRSNKVNFTCPECYSLLDENLTCTKCNFKGFIKDDMTYLHKTDNSWDKCISEKLGWIGIHKELGIYRDNEDHYYLPDRKPHLKEHYREAKRHIDKLLEIEDFSGKICLDLGAGIGWVSCYLSKRVNNIEIIALECNDDQFVGLGRANKLKKYWDLHFISLVADMHNIPIADNQIDVIFMVDSLHHFRNMEDVIKEAHRILKPKGHFYAINEAYRPDDVLDELVFINDYCPSEVKHGINERRPKQEEYLQAGEILNLEIRNNKLALNSPGLFLVGEKIISK